MDRVITEERPYKSYKTCSMCKRKYGVDSKKDNGFCPICHEKNRDRKSRLEK